MSEPELTFSEVSSFTAKAMTGDDDYGPVYQAWIAWLDAQCAARGIAGVIRTYSSGSVNSHTEVDRLIRAGLPTGHIRAVMDMLLSGRKEQ
jgi:hypothetical protein